MKKILIVEDDIHTRNGLEEVCRLEGYSVISCGNGGRALELFQSENPDLVCLDIMMPEKNGYDVCREIRQNDKDIPILFISAKGEEIDKVVGLELGGDDYLAKPFGIREAAARIRALLRRTARKTEEPVRTEFMMNGVRVVPAELRCYRDGKSFSLTPREISLLELFYRNPGKVLDRDALFDAGWGTGYLPSSRTLDQNISRLRKKIGSWNGGIIKTVHGAGYRWDGE
ncbi:MAG: response regulator transcription factor [Spirochaetia bacterium]